MGCPGGGPIQRRIPSMLSIKTRRRKSSNRSNISSAIPRRYLTGSPIGSLPLASANFRGGNCQNAAFENATCRTLEFSGKALILGTPILKEPILGRAVWRYADLRSKSNVPKSPNNQSQPYLRGEKTPRQILIAGALQKGGRGSLHRMRNGRKLTAQQNDAEFTDALLRTAHAGHGPRSRHRFVPFWQTFLNPQLP